MKKILLSFALILISVLASLSQKPPVVATPQLSVSLDLSRDKASQWELSYQAGNAGGLIMELTPKGQSAPNWDELITSNVSFNVPIKEYLEAWKEMMTSEGAKIQKEETLEDGSVLISYVSDKENGTFRYFQGPDAVYGISYQTRPKTEKKERIGLFKSILKDTKFVENPLTTSNLSNSDSPLSPPSPAPSGE